MTERLEARTPQQRRLALSAIILAGILSRLVQFLDRRSLWHDEVLIALNIASRSWSGLVAPLDYDQAAPILWLWAQRALVTLAAVNEYTLRVLSLVAGIVLVALSWKLAHRLLPEVHAVIATALVALSPMLIRYSNEAKPYAVDAAVAVGLQLLAIRVAEVPTDRRRWLSLLVAGVFAVLVSIPAIMVLAGVGSFLLLQPYLRRMRGGVVCTITIGVVWLGAFGALYLAVYRAAADSAFMKEFWEYAFLRPGVSDLPARAWNAIFDIVSGALVGSLSAGRWGQAVVLGANLQVAIALVIMSLGIRWMARRSGAAVVALLVTPAVVALIGSMAGSYPLTVRLMLFTLPALFLFLTAGIAQVSEFLPVRIRKPSQFLLAIAFLLPEFGRAVLTSLAPIRRQDSRPVIGELLRRGEASTPVYVYSVALSAWTFYTTHWDNPDTGRLRRMAQLLGSKGDAFPGKPRRGRPVVAEGDQLSGEYDGRLELYGIPTGRPVRWGPATGNAAPDSGWAENEARRIRRAGPQVWLLFMPNYAGDRQPNLSQLQKALADLGGRVDFEFHRREAELYHYSF